MILWSKLYAIYNLSLSNLFLMWDEEICGHKGKIFHKKL